MRVKQITMCLWICATCALCTLVGACAFKAHSDDYRCDVPTDCEAGRTCQDGWCVTQVTPTIDASPTPDGPTAPMIDASMPMMIDASMPMMIDASMPMMIDASMPPMIDAASQCPTECTTCVGLTCVIQCPGVGDCANLACPAGWDCEVHCDGDSACAGGVDCTAATSCGISCTGPSSCQGPVNCSVGACAVDCSGNASCTGGIDCAGSCTCDTSCGGAGSCTTSPSCPGPNPCIMGNGMCTSIGGPCNGC